MNNIEYEIYVNADLFRLQIRTKIHRIRGKADVGNKCFFPKASSPPSDEGKPAKEKKKVQMQVTKEL
jgi:hypothetical protein